MIPRAPTGYRSGAILFIYDRLDQADANGLVEKWHRHNDPVPRVQIRMCVGIREVIPPLGHSEIVGVAIVGNPCGRPADKNIVELRRVAFKPGERFGKFRRYYSEAPTKPELSLRQLPVIVDCGDNAGQMLATCKAHQIPSTFMAAITSLVQMKLPRYHTIWTYVRDDEDGSYLESAGYTLDKRIDRRGVPKRRYSRPLLG
jgi:hypothetical protein